MTNPFSEDPQYNKVAHRVKMHYNFMNDSDAVTEELHKFPHETDDDYKKRKEKVAVFNLYKKIGESTVGVITRKPPTIDYGAAENTAIKEIIENVNLRGASLSTFLTTEILPAAMSGMGAIHVDYSTKKQRPFWQVFGAEQIRHVKYFYDAGELIYTRVVFISEELRESENKPYEYDVIEKAFVMILDIVRSEEKETKGDIISSVARWEMWEKKEEQDNVKLASGDSFTEGKIVSSDFYQTSTGLALDRLPVAIYFSDELNPGLGSPIMYDIAKKNVTHMDIQSSFESGIYPANMTILGYFHSGGGTLSPDGEVGKAEIVIKNGALWDVPESDAKLHYVEFGGTALELTMKYMSKLEEEMSTEGIDILDKKKQEKTKAQWQGDSTLDTSSIEGIVSSTEAAVNLAKDITLKYQGLPETTVKRISLNRDFVSAQADPQTIAATKDLYVEGLLSGETCTNQLVSLEVLPAGTNFKDEQEKRRAEGTEELIPAMEE